MGTGTKDRAVGGTRARPDRGQVTPLLALVVVMTVMVAFGLGRLGSVVIDRAEARTAADAAALAGVTGGRAEAERLATANHGVVERFVAVGGDIEVTVRVGWARATARARPGSPGSTAGSNHGG